MTAPPQSELDRFVDHLDFGLDDFQVRACEALENGHGVLVCAPTGAGKTIVGEFAVHLALAAGTKCFYTTPIKALSNQKHADLAARHGDDQVGLLTGDSSVNPDAPIVVMTTEVLRNMLYANSPALQRLSHVVMDEVHYLADRFRGAVWEEVILHLAPAVRVVSLSATVSNAEEFGAWIQTVRGDTAVILDEHRPIPLQQHMMVGGRMFDLFDPRGKQPGAGIRREVNPELSRYIREREQRERLDDLPTRRRSGRDRGRNSYRSRRRPLSRPDLIGRLDRDGLLPAISFIFSRAGCDAALKQCLDSGLRLLEPDETAEAFAVADKYVDQLSPSDRDILGVDEWRAGLGRGFAAHHAGLLPAFRHAVEDLFVRGLVKVVFATETLALGINMPARSVVLERLVKFNGEAHVDLTAGEYTQLTGRAGRRGIDIEGHAVVVWSDGLDPGAVAGLAGARTFPLRSSFSPEYNMAVNLIERLGLEGSRELLTRSFAQFQADRSVATQANRIASAARSLRDLDDRLRAEAESNGIDPGPAAPGTGDYTGFTGYMRLREEIRQREREAKSRNRSRRQESLVEDLSALKRGQVIALYGRRRGIAVVLEPAGDRRDPKPLVVSDDAWCGRVGVRDFLNPPEVLGHMRLAKHVDRRTGKGRRDIASALRSTGIELPRGKQSKKVDKVTDEELVRLRGVLRDHPAHGVAHQDSLIRLAEQRNRAARELDRLQAAVSARTSTLANRFDRLVRILTDRGYLAPGPGEAQSGAGGNLVVTEDGRTLRRIYSESDLLICECLRAGVWQGIGPADLAGVASAMVYESRRDTFSGPALITTNPRLRDVLTQTFELWRKLSAAEGAASVTPTREPDAGFAMAIHAWASGRSLSEVLAAAGERGKPLPAGDFVRWSRQVIDLLGQLRGAVGRDDPLRAVADRAIAAIRRGVVAVELQ